MYMWDSTVRGLGVGGSESTRALRPSETMCSAVDSEDSDGPWSDRPLGATLVGIQVLRDQA